MEWALDNGGPFGPAQDIIREDISTLKSPPRRTLRFARRNDMVGLMIHAAATMLRQSLAENRVIAPVQDQRLPNMMGQRADWQSD